MGSALDDWYLECEESNLEILAMLLCSESENRW